MTNGTLVVYGRRHRRQAATDGATEVGRWGSVGRVVMARKWKGDDCSAKHAMLYNDILDKIIS